MVIPLNSDVQGVVFWGLRQQRAKQGISRSRRVFRPDGKAFQNFGFPFLLQGQFIDHFAGLAQAIYHGMDAGLIDPCIPGIMAAIFAAEAVAGKDEYCMNYIQAQRDGKLDL